MNMPPNLNQMLEQAQKLQEEMAAAQDKLKDEKSRRPSGGGMVKVVATGEGRLESLTIDPDAVDPEDVEMLQDMVLAAVNEALRQADEPAREGDGRRRRLRPDGGARGLGLGGLGGRRRRAARRHARGGGGGNRAARRAAKKKR